MSKKESNPEPGSLLYQKREKRTIAFKIGVLMLCVPVIFLIGVVYSQILFDWPKGTLIALGSAYVFYALYLIINK